MNKFKITAKLLPLDCWSIIISFYVLSFKNLIDMILISKTFKNYIRNFLPHLIKKLDCSYSQITDKGISYLKGINTLNISNCYQITDK